MNGLFTAQDDPSSPNRGHYGHKDLKSTQPGLQRQFVQNEDCQSVGNIRRNSNDSIQKSPRNITQNNISVPTSKSPSSRSSESTLQQGSTPQQNPQPHQSENTPQKPVINSDSEREFQSYQGQDPQQFSTQAFVPLSLAHLTDCLLKYQYLLETEIKINQKCHLLLKEYTNKKQKIQVNEQLQLSTTRIIEITHECFFAALPQFINKRYVDCSDSQNITVNGIPMLPPKNSSNSNDVLESTTALNQKFKRNSTFSNGYGKIPQNSLPFPSFSSQPQNTSSPYTSTNFPSTPSSLPLIPNVSNLDEIKIGSNNVDKSLVLDAHKVLQKEREMLSNQLQAERESVKSLKAQLHSTPDQQTQKTNALKSEVSLLRERISDLEHALRALNMSSPEISFSEKYTRLRLRVEQLEKYKLEEKEDVKYSSVYENILTQLKVLEETLVLHKKESVTVKEALKKQLQLLSFEKDACMTNVETLMAECELLKKERGDQVKEVLTLQATIEVLREDNSRKDVKIKEYEEKLFTTEETHKSSLALIHQSYTLRIDAMRDQVESQLLELKKKDDTNVLKEKDTLTRSLEDRNNVIRSLEEKILESQQQMEQWVTQLEVLVGDKDKLIDELTAKLTEQESQKLQIVSLEDEEKDRIREEELKRMANECEKLNRLLQQREKEHLSIENEYKQREFNLQQQLNLPQTASVNTENTAVIQKFKATESKHLEMIAHLSIKQHDLSLQILELESTLKIKDESLERVLKSTDENNLQVENDTLKRKLENYTTSLNRIALSKTNILNTIDSLSSVSFKQVSEGDSEQVTQMLNSLQSKVSELSSLMKEKVDILFNEYDEILNLTK